jgi:hypothetical protein
MNSKLFTAVQLILLLLLCLTVALLDMYTGLRPALWSCRNWPIRAEPDTFSVSAVFWVDVYYQLHNLYSHMHRLKNPITPLLGSTGFTAWQVNVNAQWPPVVRLVSCSANRLTEDILRDPFINALIKCTKTTNAKKWNVQLLCRVSATFQTWM